MSIKDLFSLQQQNTFPVSDSPTADIYLYAESRDNIAAKFQAVERFVPLVDFSDPKNFVKFGSAENYYSSSVSNIASEFPYDGSRKELNEYLSKCTYLDLYLLEKRYPRYNGHIKFSSNNFTFSGAKVGGFGNPTSKEYIYFFGGPHTASQGMANLPLASTFDDANKFELDVYGTASQSSDGRTGTRTTNLLMNPAYGMAVEFWLKKEGFVTASTEKEIVFDLWNSVASSSANYGRLTIGLTGSANGLSTFIFEISSGSTNISQAISISGFTTASLTDGTWRHYAFTFENTGSDLAVKTYINGNREYFNTFSGKSMGIVDGAMVATIGALRTSPSGSTFNGVDMLGYGKLSGSLDEFRYWKSVRNEKEISFYYKYQVAGGTNTDISNTELGVYYKFNEGITGTSSLDSVVLDYSGRISNGVWYGYPGSSARSTDSAMVLAGATETEYKDPVIYVTHPSVLSLQEELIASGSEYDLNNNSSLYYSIPSWIVDEDRPENGTTGGDLFNLTQIMSYQLDELYAAIENVNKLKDKQYISSSYQKSLPFAEYQLANQGFVTPKIFDNSKLYERILNLDNENRFELELEEVKNQIYQNVYNNLVYIYKSKGTDKSFRNLIRTYGVDSELVNIAIYPNNTRFAYDNRFEFSSVGKKFINFQKPENTFGSVYHQPGVNSYVSGNLTSYVLKEFGFTTEAEVVFPSKPPVEDTSYYLTDFVTSSIAGFHLPNTSSTSDFTFQTPDTTLRIYSVRLRSESDDVYFLLTGSINGTTNVQLTTSNFYSVYDNKKWNFAIILTPDKALNYGGITGAESSSYTLGFYGVNKELDIVLDTFYVTASLTHADGRHLSSAPKRYYFGARAVNFSGSTVDRSDIRIGSLRHWLAPLDTSSINFHAQNPLNYGSNNPSRNNFLNQTAVNGVYVPQIETLALNWDVSTVTGSNSSGEFEVYDITSGSSDPNLFGVISKVTDRIHTAKGYNFPVSSTDVVTKEFISFAESGLPDEMNSYDLVKTPDTDDEVFTKEILPVNYYFSFEKSPFRAVSRDMINMFSSLKEFNNLYHQPVQRYRKEHKELRQLRELYFKDIANTVDVDKFFDYYRWIDGSLSEMLRQLIPITADTSEKVSNVIESHVLERNHYQYNYPILKYKDRNFEGHIHGISELLYPWSRGYHPISDVEADNCYWWNRRTERNNPVITSGKSTVDSQRDTIRRVITTHTSGSGPLLAKTDGTAYYGSDYAVRTFTKLYNFDLSLDSKFGQIIEKVIHLGLNAPKGFVTKVWKAIVAELAGKTLVLDNFEEQEDCNDVSTIKLLDPVKLPVETTKIRMRFRATFGTTQIGAFSVVPFTFISSSAGVPSIGYQTGFVSSFGSNKRFDIVGHHIDTYDLDFEVSMQGPFTEAVVGGHAHRHVPVNKYSTTKTGTNNIDSTVDRPEAYEFNVTTDTITITNRDITKPRTNVARDGMAKRPLNLANIPHSTASDGTNIGNYNSVLDVVSTTGRAENDLFFNETQFSGTALASTVVSGTSEYTKLARTRVGNVIVQRFSAPGDPATMGDNLGGPGLDAAHAEYSPYNALPYRNLTVRLPLNTMLSTRSEVNGLASGSFPVVADYSGTASFHGVYRNKLQKLAQTDAAITTSSISDNYFVQHQIPRNDLHYSWITGAAITYNTFDVRTSGDIPSGFIAADGKYSSSAGVSAAITFMTASQIVSYATASTGARAFGFVEGITGSFVVAAGSQLNTGLNGINTNIIDPFDVNTMTLGLDLTASVSNYRNPTLLSTNVNTNNAYFLNSILTNRGGSFAASSWAQVRQTDKKSVRTYKKTNTISHTPKVGEPRIVIDPINTNFVITNTKARTYTFIEPAVEMDNKPISMLFQAPGSTSNILVNLSLNNEVSYFTNEELNGSLDLPNLSKSKVQQIKNFVQNNQKLTMKQIQFSDCVYPQAVYQSLERVRERINFDNNFWRSSRTDRNLKGAIAKEAMIYGGTLTAITQSSWALDAETNFETRTTEAYGAANATSSDFREGILQNSYSHIHNGTKSSLRLAPLYSRKHLLGSRYSFTPPSSVENNTLSALGSLGTFPAAEPLGNAKVFAGNAKWQTGEKAGYYNSNGQFISTPTEPFYDNYSLFAEDLRPHNQAFTVIPEFRISNFMDYYVKTKQGNFLSENTASFDIFGVCALTASSTTPSSSADTDFYKVYATSDLFENLEETLNELQGVIEPTDIKLKFKGIKKFVPYDGFYPAERTVDLATQFSKSYGSAIKVTGSDSTAFTTGQDTAKLRPLFSTLFAPGVLFNTIKSGIAVDYPIYTGSKELIRIQNADITGSAPNEGVNSLGATTSYWVLGTGSKGTSGFDFRVPFEAIYAPRTYIKDALFTDMEPNASSSLSLTASWDGNGDDLYELMANNFLAECVDFYLEKGEMSSLVSEPESKFTGFVPGTYYNMRVKLRRSTNVPRQFQDNFATPQDYFAQTYGLVTPQLKESLTMYSRPSAFGPPMAGRRYVDTASLLRAARPDSLFAYEWAYTPPYYYGEAWADIIFSASSTTHTLDDIFGNSNVVCWRIDSGSNWPAGALYQNTPYGTYANNFAMQITSSLNLFGKVPVRSVEYDANGNPTIIKDDIQGKDHVWVIQPKFETPVLNFTGAIDSSQLALPLIGSESVPRGMWHQFGTIPDSPDKGIFVEVAPIEESWINNRLKASLGSTYQSIYGATSSMGSLLDIVPFRKKKARVGRIATAKTVFEAVVAIPFVESQGTRKFFEINRSYAITARRMATNPSYILGEKEPMPDQSLVKLYSAMRKYVFPPTFDFFNYEEDDVNYAPISMYVFEFSHTFSQEDLVRIWQNLPPQLGTKVEFAEQTLTHALDGSGIIDTIRSQGENKNADLKWLVFKVKQRAKTNFEDKQLAKRVQADPRLTQVNVQVGNRPNPVEEKYSYNWPYDNFSLVEFGKMDFEVIGRPVIVTSIEGRENSIPIPPGTVITIPSGTVTR